ncbi:hypothetical protein [Cupriavidus basilensis]|uniref:hypothetical protein n=1 Tax=Cupriavidus basilensis TaxID=68895 RepID=UPI001F506DC1|nr:hypothetical protein [Cupriavidus basilensis]
MPAISLRDDALRQLVAQRAQRAIDGVRVRLARQFATDDRHDAVAHRSRLRHIQQVDRGGPAQQFGDARQAHPIGMGAAALRLQIHSTIRCENHRVHRTAAA